MASAAVSNSDPRSQPMRAAFGSADQHEGVDHARAQESSVSRTVSLYIWLIVRPVFVEIKRNDNNIFKDTTKPAMTNKMDQASSNTISIDNDKSKTIQPVLEEETPSKEDTIEYPPPAQAALVMLALLLALFLTAIVRIPTTDQPSSKSQTLTKTTPTGPHHNRHRHPRSHRRIRLPGRHRLVRRGLSAHIMLLLPVPRPRLHVLLSETRLPVAYRRVRDWLGGLRICAQLDRFHRWARDTGCGCCGYDVRWNGVDDQRSPTGEETGLDGSRGSHDWYRERGRSVARRGADDECQLAVVFLQ